MKRIASLCLVAFLALVAVLPLGFLCVPKNAAKAAELESAVVVLNTLLDEDFISNNIKSGSAQLWGHTPIVNNTTGDRAEGKALKIGNAKLIFEFNPYNKSDAIDEKNKMSLFMWVFVPSKNIGNITIRLSGEDGDTGKKLALVWSVQSQNLITDTEKNIKDELVVPGWRLIELPFAAATATIGGIEDSPVYLSKLNMFEIEQDSNYEYVSLFDVYVDESMYAAENTTAIVGTEQGNYTVAAPNIFGNVSANNLFGDRVRIPGFSECFLYAWMGEQKLEHEEKGKLDAGIKYLNDERNVETTKSQVDYNWKVKLLRPNGSSALYTFGERPENYDQVGTYRMQLVLIADIDGKQRQLAAGPTVSIDIAPASDIIWFESFSSVISTQYSYSIKFTLDNVHWAIEGGVEKIKITSSAPDVLEIISVEYNGRSGYIKVRGKKSGKATITIETECVRTADYTGRNKEAVEAGILINVKSPNNGTNKSMIIVLGCVLGAAVLGGIAIAVVAIVKHNKMDIK